MARRKIDRQPSAGAALSWTPETVRTFRAPAPSDLVAELARTEPGADLNLDQGLDPDLRSRSARPAAASDLLALIFDSRLAGTLQTRVVLNRGVTVRASVVPVSERRRGRHLESPIPRRHRRHRRRRRCGPTNAISPLDSGPKD